MSVEAKLFKVAGVRPPQSRQCTVLRCLTKGRVKCSAQKSRLAIFPGGPGFAPQGQHPPRVSEWISKQQNRKLAATLKSGHDPLQATKNPGVAWSRCQRLSGGFSARTIGQESAQTWLDKEDGSLDGMAYCVQNGPKRLARFCQASPSLLAMLSLCPFQAFNHLK